MYCKEWNYEELDQAISYEKETGLFFWKITTRNGLGKVGERAGGVNGHGGYRNIKYKDVVYPEHRLALFLVNKFVGPAVDHINGNRSDNRFCNLRSCTMSQNQWNRSIAKNNKSGHKGVSWNVRLKKWQTYIRLNGKNKFLGLFDDVRDAGKAYERSAKLCHGSFYNESIEKTKDDTFTISSGGM